MYEGFILTSYMVMHQLVTCRNNFEIAQTYMRKDQSYKFEKSICNSYKQKHPTIGVGMTIIHRNMDFNK